MKTQQPLISLLMAAYNAEKYISAAIQSALAQSYQNIELLIMNDGSSDHTEALILGFGDPRIRYFKQENRGVSAARNVLLEAMQGDFFLIFDADDILPPESLSKRMRLFYSQPQVQFVDGIVTRKSADMQQVVEICKPSFRGNPHEQLMRLNPACFSVPAWLIRREPGRKYQMPAHMSHAEDLFFYIELSQNPAYLYDYIEEEVLYYRIHDNMAMKKLQALEQGYVDLYQNIKTQFPATNWRTLGYLKYKMMRIMCLSYLRNREIKKATRVLWRMAWL